MDFLISLVRFIASPAVAAIDILGPVLARASGQPYVSGHATAAGFAVSAAVIALIAILLCSMMHARMKALKVAAREERARHAAERQFLELLLNNGMQGTVIMKSDSQERTFLGNGRLLFEMLLDGAEASRFVKAIDALKEEGIAFCHSMKAHNGIIAARGVPIANRAVIYLCEQHVSDENRKYLDLLEALPIPIWMRDPKLSLDWANSAFLKALNLDRLKDALTSNASIDWAEHEPATAAMAKAAPVARSVTTVIGGEKRTYEMCLAPVRDQLVCGIAIDVTAETRQADAAQAAINGYADMLEQLPVAMAIFDENRRLSRYNSAYARLWNLPTTWLDTSPSIDQILNELRDKRRLPEQRDFAEWKKSQVRAFSGLGQKTEQMWHMPHGKSVRIVTYPHLLGGIFVTCEDVSEKIRLESGLNLLTQVQKATLDTLDEGVAIFGTDGRLVLHNAVFATMWKLTDAELAPQPHFAEIANTSADRFGHDGIWGIVSCGINSPSPERFGEWGRARRADGRILSLSLSRLPNGATIVTFADITDLERFGAMQREDARGDAHAAA
jgi:PAS domain-containing protein